MATESEKKTLRTKLEKYEGKVNHMYLDSKGLVTVGVGHLLSAVSEAQKLGFKKANNLNASAAEIKKDYEAVKKQPANRLASFYKKHTTLTLPDTEINKLTNKHIESFEKELKKIYSDFASYPSEVRLALFDLIFNLGMPNLKNKWPTFNAAIKAKDWQKAADNSKRAAPISAERNNYVKSLLEKAAQAAKAAKP
jgi:GH24 family phage-related lysozyme (muramidase)